ncbi:MAG: DUF3014 domain-containing protein [Gammaproteobacteria bacterium]
MSKSGLFIIAGVAIVTLLYLVYLAITFETPQGSTTVVIEPPVAAPVVQEPQPVVQPILPRTQLEPQPQPPATAAAEPEVAPAPVEVEVEEVAPPNPGDSLVSLPPLNSSDSFVFENLRESQNGTALLRFLADTQIVRKFVVFVENISREEFPQTDLPYRAMQQEMPVRNLDENLYVMEASAHDRFNGAVNAFVAIDTEHALALYRVLSPLFQQAYAEIGFRNVNFDDTLRQAVNNVLQARNIEGPFQLVKPSVMYLYADSNIENLSAVQKQLIRLGPENSARLKEKLREFILLL